MSPLPTELEFFFDIGSPYAYLAATQMAGLSERAALPVRWRPFLLGAVFKAAGNVMPASVPAKARWMFQDLTQWSLHYGESLRMPSLFPLSTLRTQRALVAAGRLAGQSAIAPFALALFRAYWVDDQDVSDAAIIAGIARAVGLDADALAAATDAPETKDSLRADTDEAVRRGAFGAPAIFVGETLFWGNDRIPLLEAHLARLRQGEAKQ